MINVGAIVCLGRVSCSPQLLGACAQNGIAISFMTQNGRFLAAVNGFTPGNVLLRREQYRRADDAEATAAIARACIIGKLSNYRTVLRRAIRDQTASEATARLEKIATRIDTRLRTLQDQLNVDQLRGVEGDASADYFEVFNDLITGQKQDFVFTKHTRRSPLDNVNAMLSFLYSMLTNDLRSACESVGLDAAVGFLHRDRPGRPGLALDLMEELRPVLILVTDDVATGDQAGQRRLRKVAKKCLNFGQRVQNSVFECSVDNEQFAHLKRQLIDLINPEQDSLRFYRLGNEWKHRVEHVGVKPSLDLDEPLIF